MTPKTVVSTSGNAISLIVLLTVIGLGAAGWVMNLVAVFSAGELWPLTGMIVLRIIGIFVPPVGAILGWL